MSGAGFLAPRAPRAPEEDAAFRMRRRLDRFHFEVLVRSAVCVVVLLLNGTMSIGPAARANPVIRATTVIGFLANGGYYLGMRTGRWIRPQAYGRIVVDIGLVTVGLLSAGAAAAAPYVGLYTIIAVYAGLTLSSAACLAVTLTATGTYLAISLLHQSRWLPGPRARRRPPWRSRA